MKQLLAGVWQWSWYSAEKQLDFNGYVLTVGEHRIVIDPPPMTAEDVAVVRRLGDLDYIVITNRDHSREAAKYKADFRCQVWLPELDAGQMEVKGDRTYKDGELLPGGIWAIHLQDQKSPGECAFFLQQGQGIMLVGDALIGRPPGMVSMLPADRFADVHKARQGLRRLLKYEFDTLLVGDGAAILTGAKAVVGRFLDSV